MIADWLQIVWKVAHFVAWGVTGMLVAWLYIWAPAMQMWRMAKERRVVTALAERDAELAALDAARGKRDKEIE